MACSWRLTTNRCIIPRMKYSSLEATEIEASIHRSTAGHRLPVEGSARSGSSLQCAQACVMLTVIAIIEEQFVVEPAIVARAPSRCSK
jgi:hypothetical protein